MLLKNKTAIITGGNSGVGKEAVRLFHEQGASVCALDLCVDELEKFAVGKDNVICKKVNLQNQQEVKAAVEAAVRHFGKIDVLFNIAGIFDRFKPLTETDNALLFKVMNTNLYGDIYTMRYVLPVMLENGGGSIINVASIAGQTGFRGGVAYTVSKHGIIGLTKNTAFAYAAQGIRCNAISPSGVNTPMLTKGHDTASAFGMERYSLGKACKPRNCEANEVAELGVFLASDKASAINGAVINIDVGASAY